MASDYHTIYYHEVPYLSIEILARLSSLRGSYSGADEFVGGTVVEEKVASGE